MRKRVIYAVVAPTCMLAFAGPAFRASDDGAIRLHARLSGFQEVTPKLTSATGDFTARHHSGKPGRCDPCDRERPDVRERAFTAVGRR